MLNHKVQDKTSGLALWPNKRFSFYDICMFQPPVQPNLKDLHLLSSSRDAIWRNVS